jgi:hypothetical protein
MNEGEYRISRFKIMNITPHEKIVDEKKFLDSHNAAIKHYGDTRIGKTYKDRLDKYYAAKRQETQK